MLTTSSSRNDFAQKNVVFALDCVIRLAFIILAILTKRQFATTL